jgi:protein-tyrosine phosphatase
MNRILMVCLGNICRSPLAHGILESQIDTSHIFIDSAGTTSYHIGEPPDERSVAVARANGLDISHQRARQFTVSDFDDFDLIYAMDQTNYTNIIRLARSNTDMEKVRLFLDENPNLSVKDVPDPYYGGIDGFENVFQIIEDTCRVISKKLSTN